MESDTQFLAGVFLKLHNSDQVTSAELDRLEDIAENGHTTGKPRPSRDRIEVVDPGAAPPHATRVVSV